MTDPGGRGDTGTVRIDVTPVNDPLVALDDSATTLPGASASGQVLGNDSDADGDTLSVSAIAIDSNGDGVAESFAISPGGQVTVPITDANGNTVGTLVFGADGSYTFTAQPGYTGPVPPVTFFVSDGQAVDSSALRFSDVPTLPTAPSPTRACRPPGCRTRRTSTPVPRPAAHRR